MFQWGFLYFSIGDRPYLNMKGTGPAISSQSGTRTGGSQSFHKYLLFFATWSVYVHLRRRDHHEEIKRSSEEQVMVVYLNKQQDLISSVWGDSYGYQSLIV